MGCAQTSASVIPPDHIPIEPLYGNEIYPLPSTHIPIEGLYDNEGHPSTNALPIVNITASPPPAYVKSALKKSHPDARGRTEKLSFLIRKPPSLNKSVNFDEQVLVKARTPTPNKTWYEKSSSTMPMRRRPRNDDDEYDYDDEEIVSISSDEGEEDNEQINIESQIPTLGPPTSFLQRNQANTPWHNPNTIGSMQQSPFNTNTYATETSTSLPINRIKVRRKLPNLGPPQIASASPYQSSLQSLTVSPYQSSTQSPTVPAYRIPKQTSLFSPYLSSVRPPTPPSYQSSIQRSLPNPNAVLNEHRPLLTNGESTLQNAYYAINRRPIENVT